VPNFLIDDYIGGDILPLQAGSGSIVDDNGMSLISSDTQGGSSYILGPTMVRAIVGGVANGDFAKPPLIASDPVSASNGLPYWDWSTNAGTRVTAAVIADATSASGNVLRFTGINAQNGDKAYIERYISVLGSRGRTLTYQPRSVWSAATSSGNFRAFTEAVFVENDRSTVTGGSATGTATGTTIAGSTYAREIQANPNTNGAVPADGAYIRLRVGIQFTAAVSGTATADCCEIRVDTGGPQILITDNSAPEDYGYGVAYLQGGNFWLRANETGTTGANPSIVMAASSGNITINAAYSGAGGTPSTGNIYLTTKDAGDVVVSDDMTVTNNLTVSDNATVTDLLSAGNIDSGYLTITPSAANTPTGVAVTGLAVKTSVASANSDDVSILTTANTTVPGTTVTGYSAGNPTFSNANLTGFTVYLTRTNTTATSVWWLAIGR